MENCLVLRVSKYDFVDRETNNRVHGVNMTYLVGEPEVGDSQRGYVPLTVPLDDAMFASVQVVPGLYEVSFKQKPGRGGKPTLTATGLKFVQAADFSVLLG